MALVTVRIEWPESLPVLPEGARARVTVEDSTNADASSVVVAEATLRDLVPGRETLAELEVEEVDQRSDLTVRVHVTAGERRVRGIEAGDLVSTQSHPVLTHGHGDSVVVPLRVVGG